VRYDRCFCCARAGGPLYPVPMGGVGAEPATCGYTFAPVCGDCARVMLPYVEVASAPVHEVMVEPPAPPAHLYRGEPLPLTQESLDLLASEIDRLKAVLADRGEA